MLYSVMFWFLAVIAALGLLALCGATLEKLGWMDLGEDSKPFDASQFITVSVLVILFSGGAVWAYSAKEQSSIDQQEQKKADEAQAEEQKLEDEKNALENKRMERLEICISTAMKYGYKNGQCANGFVEACMGGSRKEVEGIFRADSMLGVIGSLSCPNMGTKYAAEFDEQYDKF